MCRIFSGETSVGHRIAIEKEAPRVFLCNRHCKKKVGECFVHYLYPCRKCVVMSEKMYRIDLLPSYRTKRIFSNLYIVKGSYGNIFAFATF